MIFNCMIVSSKRSTGYVIKEGKRESERRYRLNSINSGLYFYKPRLIVIAIFDIYIVRKCE